MGFPDKDIPKFENPKHWIKVFSEGWKQDLTNAGLSIDWRRNFITTSLNPHYNKFIEWQFRKLQEKGYVIKGKKPVVWCAKCKHAIGDHARASGEGETTQDFIWAKFRMKDSDLILPPLIEQFTTEPILFTINHSPKIKKTNYLEEIGLMGALTLVKYKLEGHPILA